MAQLPDLDLWLLEPKAERLTYPYCVWSMLEALEAREAEAGRKADWLFWVEDDIAPLPDVYAKLRAAADPVERPYMAALAYCRTQPYWPGVARRQWHAEQGLMEIAQWPKAPAEGVWPVDQVGMCAALIHRSLLGRVAPPQFNVVPNQSGAMGPDAFWSMRLKQIGVYPHVCCDVEVEHLVSVLPVGRELSEAYNEAQRHAQ